MMKKIKENREFGHIVLITIVYIAAHWFLLVATGRWLDDWVYANKNWDYMWEVFMQSSIPLHSFINGGLWLLPDGFYRVITFFLFYFGAILFYLIMNKTSIFSKEACLWITLLYIVIPVNDARITWICYGYSFGLFVFWIAFYLAIIWREKRGKKRVTLRILSLLLLLLSYDTESIMILTILILLQFYYMDLNEDWKWGEVGKNTKKLFFTVLHYMDYLVAPIVWYFGDKLLFPGYGIYGGHSYVPWSNLAGIINHSPQYAYETFEGLWSNYTKLLEDSRVLILIGIVVLLSAILVRRREPSLVTPENPENNYRNEFYLIIVGIVTFFIGFFPYYVKTNTAISTTYFDGRNALLLGIGAAIFLFYCAQHFLREKMCKTIVIVLILLGTIHFNEIYLEWQLRYYQQLQFQYGIAENSNIIQNDTFLVMFNEPAAHSCFYQANGNSWAITGEETRLFMTGIADLSMVTLLDNDAWCLNAYGMREYEFSDRTVDGIIFVEYQRIGMGTILKEKWNEIFAKEDFDKWINETKNVRFVAISKEESDNLLDMNAKGVLTEQFIYEMYY